MTRKTLALALLTVFPLVTVAAPLAESHFGSTADGWGVVGDANALTWQSGGFIQSTDKAQGDNWYFSASSAFLGNKWNADSLSFDLQATNSNPYNAWDVVLAGNGITLATDLTPNPNPTGWTNYSVALDSATSWRVIANGSHITGFNSLSSATSAQLSGVLGNLTGLFIRGEYHVGVDTGRLDNVVMDAVTAPVPEPETYAMMLAGLGLLGVMTRRRKQKAVA